MSSENTASHPPIFARHAFLDNLSAHVKDTRNLEAVRELFENDTPLDEVLGYFLDEKLITQGVHDLIREHWVWDDAKGGPIPDIIPITREGMRDALRLLGPDVTLDAAFELGTSDACDVCVSERRRLKCVNLRFLVPEIPTAFFAAKLVANRDIDFLRVLERTRDFYVEIVPDGIPPELK